MGNVNMEARQIHFRGGNNPNTVADELDSLKSGLTNLDTEVNGDATVYPYADVVTIEDAVPANLADCNVKIEPVQDLHGYDHPWVGGAGKNKLPMTVDGIKAANSGATWTGNSTTINGVAFTILTDNDGNVTGINVNGTAVQDTEFYVFRDTSNSCPFNGMLLNGCINGSDATYDLRVSDKTTTSTKQTTGDGEIINVTATGQWRCSIMIRSRYVASNQMFYPMIRLSTETDAAFAPYTNICPISGHTETSVEVTDGDETTKAYTIALGDTIYGGTVDFDSGVMTVDRAVIEYDGSEDEVWYDNKISNGYSIVRPSGANTPAICNQFAYRASSTAVSGEFWVGGSNLNFVCADTIVTLADWKTHLSNHPLQVCYTVDDTTIQLTPQQIQLLKGQNTLTASTGQISVTVNGVSGSIGAVQEQVNELAEQLPDAPTTDGTYNLQVIVASGVPTYSWVSGS